MKIFAQFGQYFDPTNNWGQLNNLAGLTNFINTINASAYKNAFAGWFYDNEDPFYLWQSPQATYDTIKSLDSTNGVRNTPIVSLDGNVGRHPSYKKLDGSNFYDVAGVYAYGHQATINPVESGGAGGALGAELLIDHQEGNNRPGTYCSNNAPLSHRMSVYLCLTHGVSS